jgi:hypothetical protein
MGKLGLHMIGIKILKKIKQLLVIANAKNVEDINVSIKLQDPSQVNLIFLRQLLMLKD